MRRLVPLLAALAALPATAAAAKVSTLPPPAPTGPTQVVPGLSYQRLEQPGPQVVHVLRMQRGAPYLGLGPVLTAGTPAKRGSLTGFVRSTLDAGSVAAVNGDLFNLAQAFPSGILEQAGVLVSAPEPSRSALAIDPTGLLSVARMVLAGRYQAIDSLTGRGLTVRSFGGVNRPAVRSSEVILYTPQYGTATPVAGSRLEALIGLDGGALPLVNAPAPTGGTVLATRTGGGMPIGPGQVVLTAVGASGPSLAQDLTVGRRVSLSVGVAGLAPGALNAIGGGPSLVEAGVPTGATEGFGSGQLNARTSRTGVGQTADGTVLLVTAEGPTQGSQGVTVAEQSKLMISLGAVTAIGMDAGGSAQQTVYDQLVIPWSSERAITDALVVTYTGMQVLPLSAPRLSPNQDGVDDREPVTVRSAQPGEATVTLNRRAGGVAAQLYSGPLGPGSRVVGVDPRRLDVPDGPYQVTGQLAPADGSAPSTQSRALIIDRTLGRLRLRAVARPTRQLDISFTLTRPAKVTVKVEDATGRVLRTLRSARSLGRGPQLVVWDRTLHRAPAPTGTYAIVVEAQTFLGRTGLVSSVSLTAPPTSARPRR
jgi:Phosphodiester glycosidase